jgi:hypothetical protein
MYRRLGIIFLVVFIGIHFSCKNNNNSNYLIKIHNEVVNYVSSIDSLSKDGYYKVITNDSLFFMLIKQVKSLTIVRAYVSEYGVPIGIVVCDNSTNGDLMQSVKVNKSCFDIVQGIGMLKIIQCNYLDSINNRCSNIHTLFYKDFDYNLIKQIMARKGKTHVFDSIIKSKEFLGE